MCRVHTEHRRARACLMGADANRWPLCDCPGDNGSLGTAVGWNVQSHCEAKVTRPRRGSGSQPDGRPLPCPGPSRRSPRPPWLSPRRHTGRSPAWVTAKSRPSLRPGTSGSKVAPPFPGSSVEGELMTTPTFNAEPVYRARHGCRWRHRECWAAPSPRDRAAPSPRDGQEMTQAPASGVSLPRTRSGDAGPEPRGPARAAGGRARSAGLTALGGRRDSGPGRVPARQGQRTAGCGGAWPRTVGAQVRPWPLQGLAQVLAVAPAPHLGGEVTPAHRSQRLRREQRRHAESGAPGAQGSRWMSRAPREAADHPTEHTFGGSLSS